MSQAIINPSLASDIKELIQNAKQRAAIAVNAELTLLYWQVGKRVADEILKGQRGEYGQQIISTLAQQLSAEFGRGWSKRNLANMVKFAEYFPNNEILHALRTQLSWTHFRQLLAIDEPLKRDFYVQMTITSRWSTRTLTERIDSQLYERTAISKKPEQTITKELQHLQSQGQISQDLLFKDPYLLDFLELNDHYLEKDLEDAILRDLEQFLLELGAGFTFIARQKRLQIDNDDFYIDLLFYNRKLKRLIAIDLKIGQSKAEYKGQMELYLRWLARYEQEPGEQPPLGIILCAGKKQEQIELLELDNSGIHVAEYLTTLPPKALLEQRLHQALERAKQRLQDQGDEI
jgi:predicted nuclease of restriction endonuclease-like (RecB) superfamily